MSGRRVTRRQIAAAISTLAELTTEDHELLDGSTRDEFAHVIYVLQEIAEPTP